MKRPFIISLSDFNCVLVMQFLYLQGELLKDIIVSMELLNFLGLTLIVLLVIKWHFVMLLLFVTALK